MAVAVAGSELSSVLVAFDFGDPEIRDDLVPVIGGFDFLSDDDKNDIFYDNAFDAVPLLTKKAVGD